MDKVRSMKEYLLSLEGIDKVRVIQGARYPILKMQFKGISIDLTICPVPNPEDIDLEDPDLALRPAFSQLSPLAQTLLNGAANSHAILRSLAQPDDTPDKLSKRLDNYRHLLRAVKLWAHNQLVSSSKLGYLGGITLSILCAKIVQLFPQKPLYRLLEKFFWIYGKKWLSPSAYVLLCPPPTPDPFQSDPCPLKVLSPLSPPVNTAHTLCPSTLRLIREKMARTHNILNAMIGGKALTESIQQIFKPDREWMKGYTAWIAVEVRADNHPPKDANQVDVHPQISDANTTVCTAIPLTAQGESIDKDNGKNSCERLIRQPSQYTDDECNLDIWSGWVEARVRKLAHCVENSFKASAVVIGLIFQGFRKGGDNKAPDTPILSEQPSEQPKLDNNISEIKEDPKLQQPSTKTAESVSEKPNLRVFLIGIKFSATPTVRPAKGGLLQKDPTADSPMPVDAQARLDKAFDKFKTKYCKGEMLSYRTTDGGDTPRGQSPASPNRSRLSSQELSTSTAPLQTPPGTDILSRINQGQLGLSVTLVQPSSLQSYLSNLKPEDEASRPDWPEDLL